MKTKPNLNRRAKNTFWAVYNQKGQVVAISKNKRTAQEEALKQSKYRWTHQTFDKDWGYLKNDGYKLLKSRIVPLHKLKELNE